ncbi:MAG: hypothetical protein FWC75_05760 [Oscillospiraceae bacterium]|nr:hypothetical protein [Oscillospiraceae bacterium]
MSFKEKVLSALEKQNEKMDSVSNMFQEYAHKINSQEQVIEALTAQLQEQELAITKLYTLMGRANANPLNRTARQEQKENNLSGAQKAGESREGFSRQYLETLDALDALDAMFNKTEQATQ